MPTISRILLTVSLVAGSAALTPLEAQGISEPPSKTVPKNWQSPQQRIKAQMMIDQLMVDHKEIKGISIHAQPPGLTGASFTTIASSLPERIGSVSSPSNVNTAKKAVTHIESMWGTPDYGKRVVIVLPMKNSKGIFIPVSMVIVFHQSPTSGKTETDFLVPGVSIRDKLSIEIVDAASLYATF